MVRERYPDQVSFSLVHYPLPQHSFADAAARVAECAHDQNRFEEMRSLLFQKQEAFGSVPWSDFATRAGVSDLQQFDACVNDTRSVERIEQGKKLGDEIGIQGTPTVLVNGWKMPGPPSYEHLDQIVQYVVDGGTLTADVIINGGR
jgi:protein-disulfide isomerase